VVVQFINPTSDGEPITNNSFTDFEVWAWDTAVGTQNGKGIDHVNFWFTYLGEPVPPLPDFINSQIQSAVKYCAFTGAGTCLTMNAKWGGNTFNNLLPGIYTMYVQAFGTMSGDSGIVSITFVKQ
jgi:hypothetical protein